MQKIIILAFILSLSLLTTNTDSASVVSNANSTVFAGVVPSARNSPELQRTPTLLPAETPARTGPPIALTMILLGLCCVFLVLIGVVILGFMVRRQNSEAGENLPSKDSH